MAGKGVESVARHVWFGYTPQMPATPREMAGAMPIAKILNVNQQEAVKWSDSLKG